VRSSTELERVTYEKNTYSFTPACACVAQDWPQTFQWGTNRVGIIFEETNLTGSVKSSIQDDLVHILSFNVASNAAFEPLSAGDVFFGKYKGRMVLDQEALPEKIPEFYYITNAETNYFVVTREDRAHPRFTCLLVRVGPSGPARAMFTSAYGATVTPPETSL